MSYDEIFGWGTGSHVTLQAIDFSFFFNHNRWYAWLERGTAAVAIAIAAAITAAMIIKGLELQNGSIRNGVCP